MASHAQRTLFEIMRPVVICYRALDDHRSGCIRNRRESSCRAIQRRGNAADIHFRNGKIAQGFRTLINQIRLICRVRQDTTGNFVPKTEPGSP